MTTSGPGADPDTAAAPATAAPAPPSRWRLLGWALLQFVLVVPLLLLLALWVLGIALVAVWVGVGLIDAALPLTRAAADWHRRVAARVLGVPVPAHYARLHGGPVARLKVAATDPLTWRDLGWLIMACTAGVLISAVIVVLVLGVITWAVLPVVLRPLMHARCTIDRAILTDQRHHDLQARVQQLTDVRAELVDHSAAELRRIERDLHDGAQVRLVSVALTVARAEALLPTEPQRAQTLLAEAQATARAALTDLRTVVRGIHPPVLADRGLVGAVEALALDLPMPVDLALALPGRPPAPVETAVYFAVAESLANVVKHAGASSVRITLSHHDGRLAASVTDDGVGGADPARGSGLAGTARRLAAFDGSVSVQSPPGGPTRIEWEVPCELSSPRTTPSSAPGSPASSPTPATTSTASPTPTD